jgi:hypothetical protein
MAAAGSAELTVVSRRSRDAFDDVAADAASEAGLAAGEKNIFAA